MFLFGAGAVRAAQDENLPDPDTPVVGLEKSGGDSRQSATRQATEGTKDGADPAVAKALEQIRTGDVNGGIKALLAAGAAGSGAAFFHLGEMYNLGIGRERNLRVALMYYRLAGRSGFARADLTRANLLYFEEQSEDAVAEAISIYKDYSRQEVPEALYVLGLLYWNGDVTGEADPIRGYGLVRRAKDFFYAPAIEAEIEMAKQLSFDAREVGRDYGRNIADRGFDDQQPLALDLVLDTIAPASSDSSGLPADWDLDDWKTVWRVEVGFAATREAGEKLVTRIKSQMGHLIPNLPYQIIEDQARPGRFRVAFGPLDTLQEAIGTCVTFNQQGFDCFSRAPIS